MKIPGLEWRWAALKNGIKDAAAYRFEFFFELVSGAILPAATQWLLWYAMFHIGGASSVAGMTYPELVGYTIVSMLFTQVRGGNLDFDLSEMIRSGTLSNYLLKPVGLVEFVYLRGAGNKLAVAGFGLVIGFVVGPFFGISPLRMLAGMAMAWLGNIIAYQVSATIASAAFYWEEAYSLLMVKNLAVAFLSGELLPLSFFPPELAWIWKSLPFYLFVYGPTEVVLGRWSWAEWGHHMGIGLLWSVAAATVLRFAWWVGIKRYVSLGG